MSARRVLRTLGLALLALVAGGVVTESALRARDARRFPLRGRRVDVGDGRRLLLDCRGAGTPTIVLESGLDHLGPLAWRAVHDSLARTSRTCAYARAGMPGSDPAPGPFDAARVPRDLHRALVAAGERAPWVLVGHSLGGPYALRFAAAHDGEVAGLVLVDPSHPAQVARLRAATGRAPLPPRLLLDAAWALSWTGVLRLTPLVDAPAGWPADVRARGPAFASRALPAVRAEALALPATLAGTPRPALGTRPLVVLTAAAPPSADALARQGSTPAQEARRAAAWRALHDDLATLSSRSRHALVPDATHYIQFDRPDVVIGAVREVVAAARGGRP